MADTPADPPADVVADLADAGFRPAMAAAKARLLADASAALAGPGDGPDVRYVVPGRIEVFGKHTDYCGGESLVCATEQGLCVAARPLAGPVLRVRSLSLGRVADLPLDAPGPRPASWAVYPNAVARRLIRDFGPGLKGVELAVAGDLPAAAGLSSSSAVVVACFVALAERNGLADRPAYREHLAAPEALAHYLGCVENGSAFGPFAGEQGVGTSGGSQDHAAILGARPGHLTRFGFCPVRRLGDVTLPDGMLFAVAVSGVAAEKTGDARAAYNAVSGRAAEVLRAWNEAMGTRRATLAEAVAATPGSLWRATDPALRPRLRQFVRESRAHLPHAARALASGDLDGFARAAGRSQRRAEVGLGNSVAETAHLARAAWRLGARGASAFGAGFGGSVWALVPEADADRFNAEWAADYVAAFPDRRPTFFTTRPAPPAHAIRG